LNRHSHLVINILQTKGRVFTT